MGGCVAGLRQFEPKEPSAREQCHLADLRARIIARALFCADRGIGDQGKLQT
jgi:hypothetical protein